MALALSKPVRLLVGGVVCIAAAIACVVLFAPNIGQNRTKLIAQLQSPRPEERALALKKLAAQNRPEDLVFFTAAAKDLSGIVRGEAAQALGKSADPRVVDLLGELLADPDEQVESKAALALAQFNNDKARAYLTLQYARQGRSTRIAILDALQTAKVQNPMATAVAAEAKQIWDRNLSTLSQAGALAEQAAAAEELGRSGRPEAVEKLEELAKEGQVVLASAAVRGLGHARDPQAVGPIALLLGESHPELREASIDALRELADPGAIERLTAVALEKSAASEAATRALVAFPRSAQSDAALCRVAVDGGDEALRIAAQAMRFRDGCPMAPVLKKLPSARRAGRLSDGAAKDAALAALAAVASLGPTAKDALPQVLPLVADPDAHVRALTLEALAGIADPSTAKTVGSAFADEQKKLEAARAKWIAKPLDQKYGPGFEPAVRALSEAPNMARTEQHTSDMLNMVAEVDRERAAAAGKILRQERAPKELVADVSDAQLAPFAAALEALGAVKADGAQTTLDSFRDDDSAVLRQAAYVGLVNLGGASLKDAENGLFDASSDVRTAVAEALGRAGKDGQATLADALPKLAGDRIFVLAQLDGSELGPEIVPVLIDQVGLGGAESALAAHLLGQLKAHSAVSALVKAVEDPAGSAQREALWALGRIGDASAAEVVTRDLNSESAELRAAAAEALGGIGATKAVPALEALKGDYYVRVREAAAATLAKLSRPAVESPK